ncbi:MAG: uroporphyrinogen-III synthase [Hyphomicrobiales bacterium]|nr:uroporphyrinogen-III synthase [Hyphomicrobiales bacterium]
MRILLTRPREDADVLAERLRSMGHAVVLSPVMETVACSPIPPRLDCDAILATSARAFRFCKSGSLTNWSGLALYCVGQRTAKAAEQAGFGPAEYTAPDAAQLLRDIGGLRPAPSRLVYIAGKDRKPALENGLREMGYSVETLVAYQTRAMPHLETEAEDLLVAGNIDAVMHFSRRSAELFVQALARAQLVAAAKNLRHVCISADAAQGLDALRPRQVIIAATPDARAMIAALGAG